MAQAKAKISPVDRRTAISESFTSFTEMTQQLQAAYRELEDRYEALNKKLQETNIELRQSFGEKERLSSYLNNILENLNSGVIVIDTEGRLQLFNRAAERILKFQESSVLGKKWVDIAEESDRHLGCQKTLQTAKVFTDEEKVIANAEGTLININFSTSLLLAPDDEVIGAVEVFYDLTKLKKLEREMARVSTLAALGKMAATIAHEVRNPLGAISGFTALLDKDTPDDDCRKKLIKKISSGVDSLNRIVNGLLEFTRDPSVLVLPVDITELIEEVVDNVSLDIKSKNIRIICEIQENLKPYPLDKDRFHQIMLNLINNAMQASEKGNRIKIVLHRVNSEIRIEVIDEGKGIPDKIIGRIFEPFFTTREKGTGLGLAIVKKLVQAHGGSIFAESRGPDKGARFVITLPIIDTDNEIGPETGGNK